MVCLGALYAGITIVQDRTMTLLRLVFVVSALFALQACEEPDRYPISGEPCGPEDPVVVAPPGDCGPAV